MIVFGAAAQQQGLDCGRLHGEGAAWLHMAHPGQALIVCEADHSTETQSVDRCTGRPQHDLL